MQHKNAVLIGSQLPDFSLPDTDGNLVIKDHLLGAPAILVAFICNQSSVVKHVREVFVKLVQEFQKLDVKVVGINSNDIETSPDDRPDRMREDVRQYGYSFPYLFDATQLVAKKFDVRCTPDFFVYSKEGKLTYHGQLDASRPDNNIPVTGNDLRKALLATLKGQKIDSMYPSSGQNIIWKKNDDLYILKTPWVKKVV